MRFPEQPPKLGGAFESRTGAQATSFGLLAAKSSMPLGPSSSRPALALLLHGEEVPFVGDTFELMPTSIRESDARPND